MTRVDRIRGCAYGALVGDALGSAFVCIESSYIAERVGSGSVDRFLEATPTSLHFPRAKALPTPTVLCALDVLDALVAKREPTDADFAAAVSAGAEVASVGGVARNVSAAPVVRAFPVAFARDRDTVAQNARTQARVTTLHPSTIACATAFALSLHDVIAGSDEIALPPEARDEFLSIAWAERAVPYRTDAPELPAVLRDVPITAWDTLSAARAIALGASDAAEAIARAAGSGGGTDAMGALVGAYVGARFGFAALPERWTSGLQGRDRLESSLAAAFRTPGFA